MILIDAIIPLGMGLRQSQMRDKNDCRNYVLSVEHLDRVSSRAIQTGSQTRARSRPFLSKPSSKPRVSFRCFSKAASNLTKHKSWMALIGHSRSTLLSVDS